jgi:cation-transporting ATPase 13A1
MSFYKRSKGLVHGDLEALDIKYGLNRFDIPMPTFLELFKEHLVAPFFVFQLFCVCLWFLDDMWYFSLFTLFMLLVFESTVVFQRLRNLQEFRSMSIAPYPIQVYRDRKWIETETDKLFPGDLVSITRSKDDCPIAADLVLLNGACIANEAMLSGESTPQLKESVQLREEDDVLKISDDKNHILFGGTKILQVTPPSADSSIGTPDGGCLALVLRTGFATQQGKLVRTIIYSTERVSANNAESLFFILFLLIFAIIAAYYVWTTGSKESERDQTKLLLHCIMIITSVVPPELPMELSMAVNNSLAMLAKAYVYCTEPFRIPFAGRVDVACFDKTGTLTAENLVVEGITGINDGMDDLILPTKIPKETAYVLAAAHALVMLEDGIIGDPMEKNTLESIHWSLSKGDRLTSPNEKGTAISIVRRFPFSSALKRMSTVSHLVIGSNKKTLVSCKGAPETIKSMLKNVPKDYDEHYKYWARRGKRVLALGYKHIDQVDSKDIKELHRKDVESKLTFAGFLIFYCPLKPDSLDAIRMLNESSHRTVMITGDNALTACHIAKEVEIVSREVLIADMWGESLEWRTVDEKKRFKMDLESTIVPKELTKYDLCCTGSALTQLATSPLFVALLPRLWVYARVSPSQKELILQRLKNAGYCTLMCGDGTNDVGALKQAHVGIALLDGTEEDVERIAKHQMNLRKKAMLEKQEELRRKWNIPDPKNPTPAPQRPGQPPPLSEAMQQLLSEMDDEVPTIKFGDASVAAPFTSKISSVKSVCGIVRQGRATLVALTQMYKILALNSLTMAYSLSVLHLAGIKQGDWQATVAGMMLTVCFFGLAKSTALEKLSPERPQPNIFNFYLILSVLGQSAVHVASLIYIRGEALFYSEEMY